MLEQIEHFARTNPEMSLADLIVVFRASPQTLGHVLSDPKKEAAL